MTNSNSNSKKSRISGLNSKLSLLSLAIIATLPTVQTYAQEVGASELEEVIVTGTRRKDRSITDSNVPIDVLNQTALEASGATETNQLLAALLPSFNFPQPAVTDGTDHVRPAQLRGLAPDHTLVLVNGKRRHSSALLNLNGSVGRGSSAVDLNSIPSNAIKRIEVLRDGAAAQYGSDAIAGVINIVLKDAAEGGSFSAIYGANVTTLDGVPQLTNTSVGSDGNLAFTTGADRERTDGQTVTLRANNGFELGEDGFINVSIEYRDRKGTNRSDFDDREAYDRVNGELDPREIDYDRYNTRFGNANVEDLNVFYNAALPMGDVELYSFGSYSKREGDSAGFNRLPGNSRNIEAIYPDGFLPLITSDINDYSIAFGMRGNVGEWDADASIVYGEDDFNFGVSNSLNTSLGAVSQTEFDAGSLINTQLTANVDLSRLIDVDMFANSLSVAWGVEYRRENYEIKAGEPASYIRGDFPGAAGSQVFPGFSPASAVDDGRHSYSLYLDLDTDIVDGWNVGLAGRYEDYSDFGSTFNGKLATRIDLSDTVSLRASASTGFRSPSLAQQFFTSIATVFVDGVPTETGTFRPSSPEATALGSPGLQEETSLNFGVGLSWIPTDSFNVTIDLYDIEIDDRIVLSSNLSGTAVEALLAGTGANRARFFLNGIDSKTQGVDVVANYDLELDELGQLNFNVGYNYNKNEVTDVIAPPAVLQGAGFDQGSLFDFNEFARFEVGSPKSSLNLSTNWLYEQWSITARATRYGKTAEPSNNPDRYENLDAAWVVDLDVNFDVNENTTVSLGANNLLDQYPDATRENVNDLTRFSRIFPYSGFSPYGFNGRYLYGKISYNF